ncbi:MAG: hypothetical protein KJO29_10670, partial [Bacteroidia bacterium]|nr:hypothetical protein [Bacteroidia bacterium]
MKTKPNKKIFFTALGIAIILLIPYEWYFAKVEQWPKGYDSESLDTWADQRAYLDDMDSKDVVILGSSRIHFDINIHLWDSITGRQPLQLAYPGSSPYHPVEDLVEKSEFNGLLLIGIAPGLFFTMENSWGANRGKAFVDHYHKRTYAQIFNQHIYDYIVPHFSYLKEGLSIKMLIERIRLPNRDSLKHPDIWPPMVAMDKNRNIRMISLMENDSVTQKRQTDIWFNPNPKNRFRDSIDVIMDHYVGLFQKFKERGGQVVFLRPPYTAYYMDTESRLYPREEYWDRILDECDCP